MPSYWTFSQLSLYIISLSMPCLCVLQGLTASYWWDPYVHEWSFVPATGARPGGCWWASVSSQNCMCVYGVCLCTCVSGICAQLHYWLNLQTGKWQPGQEGVLGWGSWRKWTLLAFLNTYMYVCVTAAHVYVCITYNRHTFNLMIYKQLMGWKRRGTHLIRCSLSEE